MRKTVILFLWAGLTLFVCKEVMAELFKWMDDTGVIHISDRPPKNVKDIPNLISISDRKDHSRPEDPGAANQSQRGQTTFDSQSGKAMRGNKNPKMEIYAVYDCPYCREVRHSFPCGRISLRNYPVERDQNFSPEKRVPIR